MTPRLPIQVDSMTSLTAVVASGPLLTYHSRVDVDAVPGDRGRRSQQRPSGGPGQCLRPAGDAPDARRSAASYAYAWTDRNGRSLPPLRIDSC